METLGDYRDFVFTVTGDENSKAVRFFDEKIAKQGRDERVLAAESQMMILVGSLLKGD